jgi:hypothetical protein
MILEIISALRSSPGTKPNDVCRVLGYSSPGDGGGGTFYWDAGSSQSDNDGTIISPGTATGRWKRLYDGEINVKWFGIKGDGADYTARLAALLAWLPDGSVLDFQYGEVGLYSTVTGVTTGDAIPLNQTIRLFGKKNITVRNGKLFVPNPGTAPAKCRFPSTFILDGCENIRMENMLLYSKGTDYGDADASVSLGAEPRRSFLAQNGGHALVVIRSRNIYIDGSKCYLAGSCGALYISSSDEVKITNCHSNPASLGYASYAVDGWCGNAATAGFPAFRTYIVNCTAFAEDLGTGSAIYCGKAGVVIEDADVITYVNGGYFADMYANGGNHTLGNAFSCASSTLYVHDSYVYNCATVLRLSASASKGPKAVVDGVTAEKIGLTAVITGTESFGETGFVLENCNIDIVSDKRWSGSDRQECRESSVFGILKTAVLVEGEMRNCIVTGNAKHMILNTKAIYGGISVYSSRITVTDFIASSEGWGAATQNSPDAGLLVAADSIITVSSNTAVGAILNWTSRHTADNNQFVYTHVRLNLANCTITSANPALRPLLSLTDPSGTLVDFLAFPDTLKGCYLTSGYSAYRLRRTFEVIGSQNLGLAGTNTVWEFRIPGNRPPGFPCLIIADDRTFINVFQAQSGYTDAGNGSIKVTLLLAGDVRNKFTAGNRYSIIE